MGRLKIDFAGDTLSYYDQVTTEWVACPVLLCTLPSSALFYGEPLASSRQEHLVPGLNNAMRYIGGVPKNILSDNMAQVVIKASRYEPVFTDLIEQWAQHHHTNMQATRVYKPKDKAAVEHSVHIAYQQIYARMRNEEHHSLKSLKLRFRELLDKINARVMTVGKWHDVIAEPTIADSILDRLVSKAHRIELKGASLRRQKSE
ncbi:MAG: ATP-binding protein [Candidatus Chlorobium antarcticum]|nr:ATP-binding protein [Candidatus Chlorobium antarcticum]